MEKALSLIQGITDPGLALNRLREYLQAFILRSLHESEAFRPLVFVGGTALRFLHDLPRFSEDLDFSVSSLEGYAPTLWLGRLKRELTLSGFHPEVTWNDRRTVNTAWIRIPALLKAAGLTGRPERKLSIKLEIDTRPPPGGHCERCIITRHLTFFVQHHDLASLMSGKLHAILCRPYPKGRDWYDLIWYLSQRPILAPNIEFLQAALDQTQGTGLVDASSWRVLVRDRLDSVDVSKLAQDVAPFLERQSEVALLTRANLETLLSKSS